MKVFRGRDEHVGVPDLLDYLEVRLAAAARRRVEEHLAGACSACRRKLQEVGRLVAAMREDRLPPVPGELHERALEAFSPIPSPPLDRPSIWAPARLLFDSLLQPAPAAVRRAVGNFRRLQYAIGAHQLELELEPNPPSGWILRGRIDTPDPELHRIEIETEGERFQAWADATGSFAFDAVPRVSGLRLFVFGPSGQYRLEGMEEEP